MTISLSVRQYIIFVFPNEFEKAVGLCELSTVNIPLAISESHLQATTVQSAAIQPGHSLGVGWPGPLVIRINSSRWWPAGLLAQQLVAHLRIAAGPKGPKGWVSPQCPFSGDSNAALLDERQLKSCIPVAGPAGKCFNFPRRTKINMASKQTMGAINSANFNAKPALREMALQLTSC